MLKDSNADSDMAEENIRRLPAGGEGWDKNMKRKRSVGAVISRPIDNDGESNRTLHHKLASEPGLSSRDSHGFRLGISSGAGGMNRSNGSSPAGSNARAILKNKQEKPTLSRDLTASLNKERLRAKESIKLNYRDENHVVSSSPITKGKASRALRGVSLAANTPSNTPRIHETLGGWEHTPKNNKNLTVGWSNNRKRSLPIGSTFSPITQWGSQRPQKFSRARRTNIVSPVPNDDEVQVPSETCSSSELGARLTPVVASVSLSSKVASVAQSLKVRAESVLSPVRLSESKESRSGENRLKEKGVGTSEGEEIDVNTFQSNGASSSHMKKNTFLLKEEMGNGVRRQGRSGRDSAFLRSSISPTREKVDNSVTAKPLCISRPASDKIGSKSGCPLKKQLERKGFLRLGNPLSNSSPDFTGQSDYDREELLAAAKLAYNSNIHACSNGFWRKVDPLFASICSEEKVYLLEQLKSAEQSHANLSQMPCHANSVQGGHAHDQMSVSDTPSGDRNRNSIRQNGSKVSTDTREMVDEFHDSILCTMLNSDRTFEKVSPLYQRVLSALILEDDIEECEENLHNGPRNLPSDSCLIDSESERMDMTECELNVDVQMQKSELVCCNGYSNYRRDLGVQSPSYTDDMSLGGDIDMRSEVGMFAGLSRCDSDTPQSLPTSGFRVSSLEHQYAKMNFDEKLLLELQSVGLYLESMPDLDDKEDEVINQEIMQLERRLFEQIGVKKKCLENLSNVIQEDKDVEGWDPEQNAMDKLVELAYKKLLATRGILASKYGVPKVSKQAALAFAKRTLARCRKFEKVGVSCFTEPILHDIIFAPPPRISEAELLDGDAVAGSGRVSGENDRGTLRRSANTKARRSMPGNSRGERKTKRKHKQKPSRLSTSKNGSFNKFTETTTHPVYPSANDSADLLNTSGIKKKEGDASLSSSGEKKGSADLTNSPLKDIAAMEELGVESEVGTQDLNSWFNFEIDGLQDHDSIGLEIPTDDLSELNMFLP